MEKFSLSIIFQSCIAVLKTKFDNDWVILITWETASVTETRMYPAHIWVTKATILQLGIQHPVHQLKKIITSSPGKTLYLIQRTVNLGYIKYNTTNIRWFKFILRMHIHVYMSIKKDTCSNLVLLCFLCFLVHLFYHANNAINLWYVYSLLILNKRVWNGVFRLNLKDNLFQEISKKCSIYIYW